MDTVVLAVDCPLPLRPCTFDAAHTRTASTFVRSLWGSGLCLLPANFMHVCLDGSKESVVLHMCFAAAMAWQGD